MPRALVASADNPLLTWATLHSSMASHLASAKPPSGRAKLLFEGKREREFYRYYQPIRELTKNGPPLCDITDEDAARAHRPFSSPDPALTAFCQLGALRLKTRRAMLFFFDSNYAYVLAEATRTLSLQNDSVLSDEDGLWLGHTMIPRGHSVCEATVQLPLNEGTNKGDSSSSVIHIVNDLAGDKRFCNRSFVKGGPKLKFYAGVPITTPKGINIGAYCVLDDEPRDGLDQDSIDFLRDMSSTVMTHLEMVRAAAEHKIGTQMIAGLGAFIDGATGFRDWTAKNGEFGLEEDDSTISHPMKVQPITTTASAVAQAAVQVGEQLQEEGRASTSTSAPKKHRSRASTITSTQPGPLQTSAKAQTLRARKSAENFAMDPAAANEQRTFARAANLVREAMNIDGVMFLDAAIGTFGGLVDTHESLGTTEQTSDCPGSAAEATTGTEGEEKLTRGPEDAEQAPRRCHILASSCMQQAPTDCEKQYETMKKPEEMTEKFLRTLLRRYRGKIWSFNEHGDASSEDESSENNNDAQSCKCLSDLTQSESVVHSPSCPKRRKKHRLDDCKEILRLFPGVRSVGFVGMWDHTRQRWYAASMFWSYSPLRLFSEESEVKYMQAFCDVILAELHRLEAQNSDRAKSDFISTISHELRSPLHGILGSVECLQEQESDSFSAGLVSQVEVCGRTLLDIIDHLLDFSKINHHSRSKRGSANDPQGRKLCDSNGAKRSRMGGLMVLDADVALDHVTEEVIETAVYSFCCSRDAEMVLNRKVVVILDIDRSVGVDWRCRVAVGAWKRICINLVSNALKYTSKGHIRVSLKANPIPDKKRRFNVVLSVSDTGRGMSRDFLENHLFRAFSQEDSLVEGTGLGMNLVAKIVKSFDGRIEVQSEKGVGTKFSITLPLERSRPSSALMKSSSRSIERSIGGVRVGVIDNTSTPLASLGDVPDETARTLLLSNVHTTLSQIGVDPIQCTWSGDDRVDMYLVIEGELREELQRRQDMGFRDQVMSPSALSNKPFIILCDSTLSARRIRAPGLGNIATGYIELVAQPAGPDRLAKGVASCLKNRNLVKSVHAMANAVTDLESMVQQPIPEQSIGSLFLPHRPRNDTALGLAPQDRRSGSSSSGKSDELDAEEAERQRSTKLVQSLASDYKFPRVPTPSLNGTNPRISIGTTGKATESLRKSPERKTGAGVSLLLVDDNPINLQLLVTYAEKFGHRKTIATDGQQAVDAYMKAAAAEISSLSTNNSASSDDHKPDIVRNDSGNDSVKPPVENSPIKSEPLPPKPQVILMDINMPVLNGFEATRQIRSFEKSRGLQAATIIALTGLGSASAQQEAFSSGVDLFLTKPVRLKELTKILDGIQKPPAATAAAAASTTAAAAVVATATLSL